MLANPVFVSLKAGLAVLIALGLDRLSGNPDHLSSAFVAVLVVSPTVLMGVRRAGVQLAGSLLGGALGAAGAASGLPALAAAPLAVGSAVGVAFVLRVGAGYPVAAFSALTVVLLPRGGPLDSLEVRLLAVGTAALSGFVVNVVVSAFSYERIFARRLAIARQRPSLALLVQLDEELALAIEEARLRRAGALRARLEALRGQVRDLRARCP